uniref:HAT C-terminal dimerisation domain-containing protein n=1 Tax=Timema bartmani TaxID=61472 RepID=A0A7R9I1Z8_9NEOP|nr:unnamed protein product [Timema bartmani]
MEPIDDPDNSEDSELEKMDLSQPQSKRHQMSIEESFKRVTSYSEAGVQHNLLVKCLLYFICMDKQPFDVVNGRGFRCFIKQLSPSFEIPTMDTLKQQLDNTYDLMVNIYRIKFGSDEVGHVALTSDVWSEMMSSRSFIGITAHFLEGGVIKSRCIVTKELEDHHTSVHISEKLEEACQQFGINKDKITCIVTDEGANMVAAANHFLGKGRHLQCFAHTLNLVIENVVNHDSVLLITNKIREIVKCFQNSVVQSDLLRSKQKASGIENPLKLILDVKTRWNSVYYMLERYIELSSIVHPILLQNPKAPLAPTATELSGAKQLLNILKPVEYVTREVSGEKYATTSKIIPLINCLRAQVMAVDETDSELVGVVKEVLLKEIDNRFGSVEECHLVALACVLDPRFKNIHFSDPKAYANAISLLRRAIKMDSSSSNTNSDSSTPTAYDFWSHHKVLVHERHNNKRMALAGEREKDEIALYLANPVAPLQADPFQQWEDMKHIFPSLYRQAQLYLLAPATSVPAERLFFEAGATLSKTRNRLLGKRMERLLFLSDCTEEDWQL